MAKRPTLTDLTSQYSAQSTVNNNNSEIEQAFDNTLSRDGSTPNEMGADLDMDSNNVLNVNRIDVNEITINGGSIDSNTLTETAANAAAAEAAAAIAVNNSLIRVPTVWTSATATNPLTLPFAPNSVDLVDVKIDGVHQHRGQYSLAGDQLTIVGGLPSNFNEIEVVIFGSADTVSQTILGNIQDDPLDGGAGKVFAITADASTGPYGLGKPIVIETDWNNINRPGFYYLGNGLANQPESGLNWACLVLRSTNNSNLIHTAWPTTANSIVPRFWVRVEAGGTFSPWFRYNPEKIPSTEAFTTFGTSVTVTENPIDKAHTEVYFDGLFQNPDEYTVATNVVTFTSGTPSATEVIVKYYHY